MLQSFQIKLRTNNSQSACTSKSNLITNLPKINSTRTQIPSRPYKQQVNKQTPPPPPFDPSLPKPNACPEGDMQIKHTHDNANQHDQVSEGRKAPVIEFCRSQVELVDFCLWYWGTLLDMNWLDDSHYSGSFVAFFRSVCGKFELFISHVCLWGLTWGVRESSEKGMWSDRDTLYLVFLWISG